jgi:hypothetical protein
MHQNSDFVFDFCSILYSTLETSRCPWTLEIVRYQGLVRVIMQYVELYTGVRATLAS